MDSHSKLVPETKTSRVLKWLLQGTAPSRSGASVRLRYPEPNMAWRPVPVLAVHGTDDRVVPWLGKAGHRQHESVMAAAYRWGRFNGCKAAWPRAIGEMSAVPRAKFALGRRCA